MKKISIYFSTIIIFITFNSCQKEEVNDYTNIKAVIVEAPNLPPPVDAQPATLMATQNVTLTNSNGVQYGCVEKKYSYASNMQDMVALNPNAGTLYPSSLVQGKFVRDGVLNSIGNFGRSPIKITMDNYGYSKVVENPDNASITQAVNELVGQNTQSTTAKINYRLVEMHSLDQAMLELGINYNWGTGALGGSITNKKEAGKNSILLSFIQEYYTISAEQPSDASNFFNSSVKASDLANKVTATNPLCYVSSVTYGRIVIAKITSTTSSEELKRQITASYKNLGGSISFTNSTTLNDSEYEVTILGGNATNAIAAAQGKLAGISEFLNSGANFSANSRGVPISYVVRHASDNSIVKLGRALEYSVYENCSADPNAYAKVHVKIDGFEIVRDCDNGVFSNTGGGEFTYDIKIQDNEDVQKRIATSTPAEVSDGGFLNIDAGPYPINVVNQNGHSLKITGSLYEWDDNYTNYTNMNFQNIEFSYPFSAITTTEQSFIQLIDYGSDCKAKLRFTVRKE